jgi:hypothetical protein
MNIKYPFYLKGTSGTTYGLATQDSQISPVYNTAAPRGFFTGTSNSWSAQTSSAYTVTSNYTMNMCNLCGSNVISIDYDYCSPTSGTPSIGDFVTIFYDGNAGCGTTINDYPILTYKIQGINPATGTTGTTSWVLTLDREIPNFSGMSSCSNYRIENIIAATTTFQYTDCNGTDCVGTMAGFTTVEVCSSTEPVSTELIIANLGVCQTSDCCGTARVLIYPSGMTSLYDTTTPQGYWPPEVINFESICDLGNTDVKIWNMNIPWSVSPAGIIPSLNEDYTKFGSIGYLGSKEYFGYQESSGQTFWINSTLSAETTDSYYYNSFDEMIEVEPNEQKAIAIVHYTNNAVDSFYGEKFALEPFDINSIDQTGFARNFKVTIPWLMWHKSTTGLVGETFYVDPNVGKADYFDVKYMQSSVNNDMNDPGLRYYHLWDTNLNSNGHPSRVGKVFPDLKTIVFDDDEIIAALSYKSNRNWTLPAPKLSLMVPNTCDTSYDDYGLLGNDEEFLYITYRFNSTAFTDSLHCNYYSKIQGPSTGCTIQRQDVAIKFGDEFPFLKQTCSRGFSANELEILAQVVTGSTTQPNPGAWKKIDYTNQLSGSSVNGQITPQGMSANTFTLSYNQYYTASTYNLDTYINLPALNGEEDILNFGDEYYFYGNIETDIQATIYEMRFLCNLSQTQFNNSSNPTWTYGNNAYITEVGLFDTDKDLVVITKLQSPILRQGSQQYSIKIDF